MNDVERYQWIHSPAGGSMQSNPNGSWCKWNAVKKLIAEVIWANAEIAILKERIERMKEEV